MKTLPLFGVSLLVASMGLVVMAPVHAAGDAMAVSLAAIMTNGTATGTLDIANDAEVTGTVISSLSLSAAAGVAAVAGGMAKTGIATSIAAATDGTADLGLGISDGGVITFETPVVE